MVCMPRANITESSVETFEKKFCDSTGHRLTNTGRQSVKKWLRRYELPEVLEVLEISLEQYLIWNDEEPDGDSITKAFQYVPRILSMRRQEKKKPYLPDLFYIRGILRNRIYVNEARVMYLLEDAYLAGATIYSIQKLAKTTPNWTQFQDKLYDFISKFSVKTDG